jgi:hypothetical protein
LPERKQLRRVVFARGGLAALKIRSHAASGLAGPRGVRSARSPVLACGCARAVPAKRAHSLERRLPTMLDTELIGALGARGGTITSDDPGARSRAAMELQVTPSRRRAR